MSKRTLSQAMSYRRSFTVVLLLVLTLVTGRPAAAREGAQEIGDLIGLPQHPTFPLLDEDGVHVLISGQPVSTMKTCGGCHDTGFIASHSFHADAGLETVAAAGDTSTSDGLRTWELGSGWFGQWSPITYRILSDQGAQEVDLSTADWLKILGARHVGGGPATTSRQGLDLRLLTPSAADVEASVFDEQSEERVPWDWATSGVVEMNCFLCHLPDPNNGARIEALKGGEFGWANSATLIGTGVIERVGEEFRWSESAFVPNGDLVDGLLAVQDPADRNCGLCHGLVQVEPETPVLVNECAAEQWSTITTGQIMSPQRIADSGINLADKGSLRRSWDVHAERVVECTDCHHSLNNPVYYRELTDSRPDHLLFDPRRLDLGEYLFRPLHEFARGDGVHGSTSQGVDNTVRTCQSCHDAPDSHTWLPYAERHMDALSCESCHVPHMYAPAREYIDWTVLNQEGEPQVACRGVEGTGDTFATALVNGFEPILMPVRDADGQIRMAPHNLVTSWYWIYGDPARPVPLIDLQAAWLEEGDYPPEIVSVFDENGDRRLDESELVIDSQEKEAIISRRLEGAGLDNPRIIGEVQPYSINHNVTNGEWATRDCQDCHGDDSRVFRPMLLSDRTPGGVLPVMRDATSGQVISGPNGELTYQLEPGEEQLYVLGRSRVSPVDRAGAITFLLVFAGVVGHGGLRVYTARRRSIQEPSLKEVYMYTVYERFWHWLQTAAIFLLICTGFIIHKPDMFGMFSFRFVVQVHNILASILVVNAFLALFYHLASGEIRQFIPRPRGFFAQAVSQASFYIRGIFKGEAHPFEKSPERKMNPLQQITYLGLLNVLLPLQVVTGILMWGAQRWPDFADQIGGLTYLGPVHTIISWLLASFIVMHVYLTTTGLTPTASIKAMMLGWDEIEMHGAPAQGD